MWTDMHTGQADVRGNPVTTSGSSPGGLGAIVAPGPEAQTDTGIASNGDAYLVVWNAYRADTPRGSRRAARSARRS